MASENPEMDAQENPQGDEVEVAVLPESTEATEQVEAAAEQAQEHAEQLNIDRNETAEASAEPEAESG
ncbi:MAG TPA: hypothetical protein VFU32_06185, partial [Ktedonobacterales bacterium]|nr:hypothetical protein [Ktedonobacterales bacterium]